MPDFLTNLVAKTFNQAPVLEPRARSLYEPRTQSSVGEFLSQTDSHSEQASDLGDTFTPPQSATPASVKSPTQTISMRHESTNLTPVLSPAALNIVQERPANADERQPHIRIVSAPRLAAPSHPTETVRIERAVLIREQPASFSDAAREQPKVAAARNEAANAPAHPILLKESGAEPRDRPPAPSATLVPKSVPQITPTQRAAALPETVNVTIGRVEVRAMTTRTVRKDARASQPSTLADYLRRSSNR